MTINEVNLNFNGHPANRTETTAIVLHHADAETCSIEDINRWHKNNGWIGCGYHYLVRKDGSVWRGRPEEWVGAHSKGSNKFAIGICFEGDYEKNNVMPDAQIIAGHELIQDILSRYPGLKIGKHKDYDNTACPGNYFPFDKIVNGIDSDSGESSTEAPAETKKPLLVNGSTGDYVRELQQKLVDLGYSVGSTGVDGQYGKNTVAAVKQFQELNGLDVDGKCGDKTWAKIDSGSAVKYTAPVSTSKPLLVKGSKGNYVKECQNALKKYGYPYGVWGSDGTYGDATVHGVMAFQRNNGLDVDGKCGDKTWAKIDSGSATNSPSCPYGEPSSNIKKGSKGDGVRWVQWHLTQLGYSIGSSGIDGDCGSGTVAGIKEFQRDFGVSADGICGTNTRNAMRFY